jgi:enediyne biosynthesis protein E4
MNGGTVNFVVKFAALALMGVAGFVAWKSTRSLPSTTEQDRDPQSAERKPRQPSPLKIPRLAASVASPIHFDELSQKLGVQFEHRWGDYGAYWLPEAMGGGAAWFDLDGDGWQDLFFVQGKRVAFGRDVLFRSDRGKRFHRSPEDAVPADPEFGQGVGAGDFNNDGFDDLYVTNFTRHRLYRNNGDGTLADATASAGLGAGCELWGTSVAFGDLDSDGALDLVVCNYAEYVQLHCKDTLTGERRYCGPESYKGRPIVFLHNLGDGRFRDESQSAGLGLPLGKCLGVVVARVIDDENSPQVFIANDLLSNFFFQKKPSTGSELQYQEIAADLRVDRNGEGVRQANMGVAIGDYDRDGRLDLFSTHYYNEHDTLWRNLGAAGFRDVTKSARLFVPTLPQLSWGTQFLDADNDGWLDLFVTSGNIDNNAKSSIPYRMTPQMFWNRGAIGDVSFDDVSMDVGPFFRVGHVGRGSAACDFDRDGRGDLVVVNYHENVALLQNRSEAAKAIGLEFIGVVSPRDGHGARATISGPSASKPLVREIHGGGSYLSADARSLLIGVGVDDGPYSVEVDWPSGRKQRCSGIVAGSWITLLEGRTEPIDRRPFTPRTDGGASKR